MSSPASLGFALVDERFTGLKHFWSAIEVDRPRKLKNLEANIELYAPEGDFSEEERIQYLIDLTGLFPMDLVIDSATRTKLQERFIPPISEFDSELQVVWFIPRKVVSRKTKNGKDYWIIEVIDDSSATISIRCWGVRPERDMIHINKPYMARLDYDPQWGFSTRSLRHNFRLLG